MRRAHADERDSVSADLRSRWGMVLVAVVALAVWGWLDVRNRGEINLQHPDQHRTDFTVYTLAGAEFFKGGDAYGVTNIRGWGYIYPPLFALTMAPLASLDPKTQVLAFFVLSVLVAAGCGLELRRLVFLLLLDHPALRDRVGRFGPRWIAACTTGAILFPVLNNLQRGQIGLLKLYPLLLGARWLLWGRSPGRCVAGGLLLAAPIVLKVTPALPVACLMAMLWLASMIGHFAPAFSMSPQRPLDETHPGTGYVPDLRRWLWGGLGVVAGSLLFWLLIPAAALGWNANLQYLAQWHAKVIAKAGDVRSDDFGGDVVSLRNQSLANSAYRFGNWAFFRAGAGPLDTLIDTTETAVGTMPMDARWANRLVKGLQWGALALLGAVAIQMGRRGDRLSLMTAFALACVGTLVISPVSRGHYFLLYGPATVAVPLWLLARDKPRLAIVAAALPAILCMTHYLALSSAGRIGVLGLGTTGWFFAVGAVLLTRDWQPHCGSATGADSPDGAVRRRAA